MAEGIRHFRRKKCVVLNLDPIHTKEGQDLTIRFLVNGRSYNIKHGEQVDLIEPAYNALLAAVKRIHEITTKVNPKTGDTTHGDNVTLAPRYSVNDIGDWYWPEEHTPYDKNGDLIREDLTKEELAKAPIHVNMVKKSKTKVKEAV